MPRVRSIYIAHFTGDQANTAVARTDLGLVRRENCSAHSPGRCHTQKVLRATKEGIGQGDPRVISCKMIKNRLLLVAIIATSVLLPAAVRAAGIAIQIGDQPYYNHGPRYWTGNYQMIWVPGHMSRGHHWIHGQYVRAERRQRDWNGRHDRYDVYRR
jgi:hypothetical protein